MRWLNVASLRMDKQRGRPVLLEFFDVCRPASLRTLPYLQAWHERYEADGLRVISVHAPGFAPGRDEDVVAARSRAWASSTRSCSTPTSCSGGSTRTRAGRRATSSTASCACSRSTSARAATTRPRRRSRSCSASSATPVAHLHPEDDPDARIVVPTPDQEGAWSGPYEAGAVWAVLEGPGTVTVNGEPREIGWTGVHLLVEHPVHTEAVLELGLGPGVVCHGVQFEPGLRAA